jgi:hypothetical protein
MRLRTIISFCLTTFLVSGVVIGMSGCRRSQSSNATVTVDEAPSNYTPEPTPKTEFERDLRYIRKSNFAHVWLFARKDGKVIDKDDAAFFRTNAPQVVDWIKTDGGTKVLAGTNFDLELAGLNQIRKRYVVEDYTGK